jgi:hypothetical protein
MLGSYSRRFTWSNRRADALGFVLGLVVGAPVGLVIDNSIVIVS